jgi:hypothetical protein
VERRCPEKVLPRHVGASGARPRAERRSAVGVWLRLCGAKSRAAQISWHGRPARAHGEDGRATLGCGSAALRVLVVDRAVEGTSRMPSRQPVSRIATVRFFPRVGSSLDL